MTKWSMTDYVAAKGRCQHHHQHRNNKSRHGELNDVFPILLFPLFLLPSQTTAPWLPNCSHRQNQDLCALLFDANHRIFVEVGAFSTIDLGSGLDTGTPSLRSSPNANPIRSSFSSLSQCS